MIHSEHAMATPLDDVGQQVCYIIYLIGHVIRVGVAWSIAVG